MDFFAEQDLARKRSGRLVVYFLLAVVAIMLAVYFAAILGWNLAQKDAPTVLWEPRVFWGVIGGLTVLIALGSLFRISTLNAGGPAVAEMVGGRLISPNSRDRQERRLLNIVEEMALASGTSVPPVYMMEEKGINAFAAGYKIDNAVIGVTRGAVEKLNREELQGVIAHEFSHILHGDMKLNIRLMGVLYGILMISMLGSILMRVLYFSGGRRSSSKDNSQAVLLAVAAAGVAMYIIGYVGVFFGNFIKAAVSRQREYLADASAVQYTRNPHGIAGALKKIGGFHTKVENPQAAEASHFFFGPISSFSNLLSTHPPLEDRIARIEPYFKKMLAAEGASAAAGGDSRVSGFAGGAAADTSVEPNPKAAPPVRQAAQGRDAVLASIGDPRASHMAYGQQLIGTLPETLRDALRDTYLARAVVCAALLDPDANEAAAQLALMRQKMDPLLWQNFEKLRPSVQAVPHHNGLELVALALPALSQMAVSQRREYLQLTADLINADAQVTVYEYGLRHMLHRVLDGSWATVPGRASTDDIRLMLMTVAAIGAADDDQAAATAFVDAAKACQLRVKVSEFDRSKTSDWAALDLALRRVSGVKPKSKRRIVAAALQAIAHDGVITPDEGNVLRAIALALDCPIPPLVAFDGE